MVSRDEAQEIVDRSTYPPRRFDHVSTAQRLAETVVALHDALAELVDASRGYVGCDDLLGAAREDEWSPCGACWGCRLAAAVQRADALAGPTGSNDG